MLNAIGDDVSEQTREVLSPYQVSSGTVSNFRRLLVRSALSASVSQCGISRLSSRTDPYARSSAFLSCDLLEELPL